jgi:Pyrimidine dimer DNA glycosylase
MQTFLPYPDFARSAEVLDVPRLGKQRVETLQVLRALELGDYGWRSHPVVRMWRGRTSALVAYGLTVVRAWTALGHADSTHELIAEFAPEVEPLTQADLAERGLLPSWLGDERVHRSHRSALVRKDPQFYRPLFRDVPDDLPYHWPDADELPPAAEQHGPALWVVRAPGVEVAHAFLTRGFVAIGQPRPGSAKGRRQLEAFSEQVQVGDLVAVPVGGGATLAVGEIIGAYRKEPPDRALPHRRAVRWVGELARAAVRSPAQLQDPRSLFRVQLTGTIDLASDIPGTSPPGVPPGRSPEGAARDHRWLSRGSRP